MSSKYLEEKKEFAIIEIVLRGVFLVAFVLDIKCAKLKFVSYSFVVFEGIGRKNNLVCLV